MNATDGNGALREGWARTTLGALGVYLNGRAFKSTEWSRTGRQIIRIQDLTGSSHNPNYYRGEADERHVVRTGDFLISWSATLGAYIWTGPEAVLNQHIFKVLSAIDQQFHYHLVRNEIADLERRAHGSGMVHVTKGVFDSTAVELPPLPEQRRIAVRLDEIEMASTTVVAHLASARSIVQRFRTAVVAAACSGRLTADWRQDDSNSTLDVPRSWRRATLGELTDSIRGGSSEVPTVDITAFPVLRSSSVRPSSVDYDDVRYLSREQSQKAANFVQDGDLLITRLNGNIEYVGNAALVGGLDGRRVQYPDRLFRLRLKEPAHAPFVELFLASPRARAQVRAVSRSAAGHQRISIADLKGFSIELPPLNEQHEIVRRVNATLAAAAHITDRVDQTATALERVFDACLAKAFRGELVPTEAALAEQAGRDFESAGELLARMESPNSATPHRPRNVAD